MALTPLIVGKQLVLSSLEVAFAVLAQGPSNPSHRRSSPTSISARPDTAVSEASIRHDAGHWRPDTRA